MNYYLFQISYTSEMWQTLINERKSHTESMQLVIKNMGGEISASWVCVGEYDEIALIRLPDEVTALAAVIAFKAGGGLREVRYLRLLSWTQGVDAMAKVDGIDYRPTVHS